MSPAKQHAHEDEAMPPKLLILIDWATQALLPLAALLSRFSWHRASGPEFRKCGQCGGLLKPCFVRRWRRFPAAQ
jgi:hypothetical protein